MADLTTADLDAALSDDRHLGFGYAEREYLFLATRERLDREIVQVANEIGLDYEDLFRWANSKHGRWLCDAATDRRPDLPRLVRESLSREVIDALRAEEGVS